MCEMALYRSVPCALIPVSAITLVSTDAMCSALIDTSPLNHTVPQEGVPTSSMPETILYVRHVRRHCAFPQLPLQTAIEEGQMQGGGATSAGTWCPRRCHTETTNMSLPSVTRPPGMAVRKAPAGPPDRCRAVALSSHAT